MQAGNIQLTHCACIQVMWFVKASTMYTFFATVVLFPFTSFYTSAPGSAFGSLTFVFNFCKAHNRGIFYLCVNLKKTTD